MSLPVIDGFDNRSNNPLDINYIVANVAALDTLKFKHKGMWRWVTDAQAVYILQNDLSTWKSLSVGKAITRWVAGSYNEFDLVISAGALFESQKAANTSTPGDNADWVKILGQKGDPGEIGTTGKSAYEIWLDAGNIGDVNAFLADIKGEKGDPGEKGDTGADGEGLSVWSSIIAAGEGYDAGKLVRLSGDFWESQVNNNTSIPGENSDWLPFHTLSADDIANALGFTPEAAITPGTNLQYWRGDKTWQTLTTSVVTEGLNLYYTAARFNSAFTAKSTSDLAEGSNKYYTDARVAAYGDAHYQPLGSYLTSINSSQVTTALGYIPVNPNSLGSYAIRSTGLAELSGADFVGNISTPAIKLTSGATAGYYLRSDASGNGTWQPITAGQVYVGTWNASTNSPTLTNGSGTAGNFYRVTTAGSVNFGAGSIAFNVGDDVQYNGTVWQRIPAATITGNALTKTDDTNVTLTLGGAASTALLNAASITVGWSGTLADGRIASANNWNIAYAERNQWDGGSTGLNATTARASLGLVIGTNVLAYRTFGSAANNNTGDFEVPLTFSLPLNRTGNTISIQDAGANGATKGVAAFAAADFNETSGVISIDYTSGQAASGSTKGFLTSTDWATFNNKQSALGFTPLNPGNNLSEINSATAARINLGLVIGTDVLAYRTFGTAANNNTGDFVLSSGFTTSAINTLYGYTPANGANYLPLTGGILTGDVRINGTVPYLSLSATAWVGDAVYLQGGVNATGTGIGDYLGVILPTGKKFSVSVTGTSRLDVNPSGINVTGITTSTSFSGAGTGLTGTASGLTVGNSALWNGETYAGAQSGAPLGFMTYNSGWRYSTIIQAQTALGLGSYAYRSSGLAELTGATFSGNITAPNVTTAGYLTAQTVRVAQSGSDLWDINTSSNTLALSHYNGSGFTTPMTLTRGGVLSTGGAVSSYGVLLNTGGYLGSRSFRAASDLLIAYGGTSGFNWTDHANSTVLMSLNNSGNLSVTGTFSASGYNKTNWDAAYGWGNHASAGYLTASSAAATYAPLSGTATYSEGTWSPSFSMSMSSAHGRYTKIGNMVYAWFSFIAGFSSSGDDFEISNLPFPISSNSTGSVIIAYQTVGTEYINGSATSAFDTVTFTVGTSRLTNTNLSNAGMSGMIIYSTTN